ncbi:hypothetical protein DYB32_010666 [Aphanomyces invadans]|uniref:DDE-1 domain-containing protein n=1 Tax=Aphanomyces invadans TaxID=157072 RepID=A0A418AFC3_9STRA|nr:hypothetical protein DYB32_010666 [Aphanomyces invadans]
MTQYIFVLYLTWVNKMFPDKRILLVVDRSTTHYGKLVSDWLTDHHSSASTGKVFVEYISEGMTSVQQVCDIAINKPLKELIKKEYFNFRFDALQEKTAAELAGCTLTVPREDLIGMIESAVDAINLENQRRRWIARTFALCGQDPWSEDDSLFVQHLSSLEINAVYGHMKTANEQLKLL